jgi:hypothetical protein
MENENKNIVLIPNQHSEITLFRIINKISSQLENVIPKNMYNVLFHEHLDRKLSYRNAKGYKIVPMRST